MRDIYVLYSYHVYDITWIWGCTAKPPYIDGDHIGTIIL